MAETTDRGRNWDDEGAGRAYVNALAVDFTLAEFTLDFLQGFGETPLFRARLVTAPANMPAFRDVLSEAIADYERRFGALGPRVRGDG